MPFLRTSASVLALSVLALPSAVNAAPKPHGTEARGPAKTKGPVKAERCRVKHVKVQRQGRTVTVKETVCTPTKPSPRR